MAAFWNRAVAPYSWKSTGPLTPRSEPSLPTASAGAAYTSVGTASPSSRSCAMLRFQYSCSTARSGGAPAVWTRVTSRRPVESTHDMSAGRYASRTWRAVAASPTVAPNELTSASPIAAATAYWPPPRRETSTAPAAASAASRAIASDALAVPTSCSRRETAPRNGESVLPSAAEYAESGQRAVAAKSTTESNATAVRPGRPCFR